nr:hypothetical protein [Tanacetum cinerariifolium]
MLGGGYLRFEARWLIACSIAGKSQTPEKVTVTSLFYLRRMDVGSVNIPYLLARYLRLFASRRKRRARISGAPPAAGPARTMAQRVARLEEDVHGMRGALGEQREVLKVVRFEEEAQGEDIWGQFVARLAEHFRLLTEEIL